MYQVAIVGCGAIAQYHADAIQASKHARLSACVDIHLERAEALARPYGASAYSSLDALFSDNRVDVVHLCTPHHLHAPMVQKAAAQGIHVFTEKPCCINREQWLVLDRASKHIHLGVCFQNRYNGAVQAMKDLLPGMGKVLSARSFVTWNRDAAYYQQSDWRGKWDTEGGSALINQAIHTLDLMVYLLGRPHNLSASLHNHHLKGVIETEDTVEASMAYGDAAAVFYASTAYPINSPVLLEITCQNGTLRMEKNLLTVRRTDGTVTCKNYDDASPDHSMAHAYWGRAHWSCIDDFYRALIQGEQPPVGIPQVKDTMDILFQIYGR